MIKDVVSRLFTHGQTKIEGPLFRQVLLLTLFYTLIMMATVIGTTTADTLFLSHYDTKQLSYMYLYITIAVVIAGILFQKLSERMPAHRLLNQSILYVGLFSVLTGLALKTGAAWIYPVMFVGYEANSVLVTMAFFTFMASVLDARQAKLHIGTVAAGGVGGAIVGGFVTSTMAPLIGTEQLVYVFAALVLSGLWFVRRLSAAYDTHEKLTPPDSPPGNEQAPDHPQGNLFKQIPILKYIAVIIGTISVAITLSDYQFKMTLAQSLTEEELARFLGQFYSVAGIISFIFQIFISTRLLTRYGIVPSFLVMPLCMLTSSVAFWFAPVLAVAVVMKGSYRAFAETIHQSVSELMYFPIPAHLRGRAKGLVNGVIDYGMSGVAAILLIVLADRISLTSFSFITVPMLAVAVIAIFPVKKEYVHMLLATLRTRQEAAELDLSVLQAPYLIKVMEDRSKETSDMERLHAFRLLARLPGISLTRHLEALLREAPPVLQIEVLQYIEQERVPSWKPYVFPLLHAENRQLRAQAIQTFAAYADQSEKRVLLDCLHDPAMEIQFAAIYGLLKYFGPDEQLYASLQSLLHDVSPSVRRLALATAGKLADERLLPDLFQQLANSGLKKEALAALSGFPVETLLMQLQAEWDRPEADETISHFTARIVGQQADAKTYPFLLQAYEKAPTSIRSEIADVLVKLKTEEPQDSQRLAGLLELEVRHAHNGLRALQELSPHPDTALVMDALQYEIEVSMKNMFALLALHYERRSMEMIRFNLESGDERQKANALEALDQWLSNQLRALILPVVLAKYDKQSMLKKADAHVWQSLFAKGDAWLQTCLTYLSHADRSFVWQSERDLTEEEHKRLTIVGFLKRTGSFSDLPGGILAKLAARMSHRDVENGTAIIRQGEMGQAMYLLLRGEVDVVKDHRVLQHLQEGELFGEMSLFDREERSASVIAASPVTIGMIDEEEFADLLHGNMEFALRVASVLSRRIRAMNETGGGRNLQSRDVPELPDQASRTIPDEAERATPSLTEKLMVLFKVDMFASLSHSQLAALAEGTTEVRYRAGETIVHYGETGDAMYGIIAGSVRVEREGRAIAELHQGDVFGEMALLERSPRSATVTALEDARLVKISDELFYDFCLEDETVITTIIAALAARLRRMTAEAASEGADVR
ncbi:cyclic nucleotide-binding domain-containing protein [Brevibacillus parabrevis]|uniref:cyclic nucleotide-binding domain-containing protein n=1 Tax=Brevibacillus parabrevis TaxID=54914 RepID=UPI002E1BE1D5|nr:cyclic nucleotide-binding domain-containing protein [Brevibacillus parabrevis]